MKVMTMECDVNKRNPRVGKRKKMNIVMQNIKLAFWGVMEGDV
jgi:hypothetical protein